MPKNQALSSQAIPFEWQPKYYLKRIGEKEDLTISKETRDMVLQALAEGRKFVQIGEYTIMLSSMKSMEPVFGKDNIPPRPVYDEIQMLFAQQDNNEIKIKELEGKKKKQELWDQLFGKEDHERLSDAL